MNSDQERLRVEAEELIALAEQLTARANTALEQAEEVRLRARKVLALSISEPPPIAPDSSADIYSLKSRRPAVSGPMPACPRCEYQEVHPSATHWYDFAARLFGRKPYRCHACFLRFYAVDKLPRRP